MWTFSGIYMVTGVGETMSADSDQLNFVYTRVSGDPDLSTCIEYVQGPDPGLTVGVMFRESLEPGSPAVAALFSPSVGAFIQSRGAQRTNATAGGFAAAAIPLCLRLVRAGDRFTAYMSTDRLAWIPLGTTVATLPDSTLVGMALSSHGGNIKAQTIFSAVALTTVPAAPRPTDGPPTTPPVDAPPAPSPLPSLPPEPAGPSPTIPPPSAPTPSPEPDPLPAPAPPNPSAPPVPNPTGVLAPPWINQDIGGFAVASNVTSDGGTFSLSGGGLDLSGSIDQLEYVYRAVSGDFDIVTQLVSITALDPLASAGLMLRSSLDPSASSVFVGLSNSQLAFIRRPFAYASTLQDTRPALAAAPWLRLSRRGYVLKASSSIDGTTWADLGSQTIPMAPAVYAGLALSSHSSTIAAQALFTDVAVSENALARGNNQAPTVQITSPASGPTVPAGTSLVTITASASDADGSIARVDFYVGSVLIGSATAAPYEIRWYNPAGGLQALKAVAVDDEGAATTSSIVQACRSVRSLPRVRRCPRSRRFPRSRST